MCLLLVGGVFISNIVGIVMVFTTKGELNCLLWKYICAYVVSNFLTSKNDITNQQTPKLRKKTRSIWTIIDYQWTIMDHQ